jgi:hypothetical protein
LGGPPGIAAMQAVDDYFQLRDTNLEGDGVYLVMVPGKFCGVINGIMESRPKAKLATTLQLLGALILGGGLLISGCANPRLTSLQTLKSPELAAQLKSFVAEKEAQANAATNKMPSEFHAFFAVAAKGDWRAVSNAFVALREQARRDDHSSQKERRLHGPAWQMVVEIWGALRAFGEGDEKYSLMFGTNIISSIPAGSIYFGGTDAGRFIISALQKSHRRAEPFFTLTQGALPDATYLEYLRGMYGAKINIPTEEDSKKCLEEYMEDAAQRRGKNQLKPGEIVTVDPDGKIRVSGYVAVLQVKGLLAKIIFDKNPDREFYLEEGFPFDWMYPHLEPHGLIFRINRQPLPALSGKIVEQDHDHWRRIVRPMIGDWLTDDTPVEGVAAFVRKTFGKKDLSGFAGDTRFIENAYSRRMYSKLRSSHAGLYAWRMQNATDSAEKARMAREADFASRQAWALCPDSAEVVFRYLALLMEQKRGADALLVTETAAQMPSMRGQEGQQIRNVIASLKETQKKTKDASAVRK